MKSHPRNHWNMMVLALVPVLLSIYPTAVISELVEGAHLKPRNAALGDSSSSSSTELSPLESLFSGLKYCDINNITCPYCDNAFTYAAGSEYEVECDVARTCPGESGSGNTTRTGPGSSMNISIAACLGVCEAERPDCKGGSYSDDGCVLCLGDVILYESSAGYTGFIPATLSIAVLSPPPLLTAPLPPTPNVSFTPYPFPNSTVALGQTAALPTFSGSLVQTATGSGITPAPYPLPNATDSQASGSIWTASSIHVAPGSGGARCNPSNLQCPLCDGAVITDSSNMPYVIRCDSYIFSNRSYTYPGSINSSQCLGFCDQDATCAGGFLAPGNRCTLAHGSGGNVSVLMQPGYISFLAVNKELQNVTTTTSVSTAVGTSYGSINFTSCEETSTALQSTTMENVTATAQSTTTGDVTASGQSSTIENVTSTAQSTTIENITATVQPIPGSSSHASFTYLPSATPSLTPEDFCDPSNLTCPGCDGLVIQDAFDQSYRIQCNYEPTCERLFGYYGKSSVDVCLHHCDISMLCHAAIFSNGHCDLCEGTMEGAYGPQNGYTVFIPETAPASLTIAASTSLLPSSLISSMSFALPVTTVTDRMITNSRIAATPMSSSSASLSSSTDEIFPTQSLSPISAVTCPNSDNEMVLDPSDNRRYQVQCDTLYGASSRRHVVVDDFQSCAASCEDQCNGFLFGFGSNCILLTGVSAVASVTGWTAGVQVVQSTATASPSMVLRPSV